MKRALLASIGFLILGAQQVRAQAYQNGIPPVTVAADMIQMITPASGDTVVSNNNTTVMIINPSLAIALLTVALPSNPVDNQRWGVVSSAAITVMSFTGGAIPIKGAATGLGAFGYARFIYSASANAWFRTG